MTYSLMDYICNGMIFHALDDAIEYANDYHDVTSDSKGYNGIILGIDQVTRES